MDIREKLVDILRKPIFPHELVDPIEAVADYLLDSGVTVQEWIPVTEPPKAWRRENGDMVNYLVHVPEFGVDIGNYAEPAKCWLCMGIPCKPTHWAYLPQPPKGE